MNIAGIDPARILVIGDGPAAGFGVRTHQLGIAGHLARHLGGLLARGVVVTVLAQPAASARSTLKRLDDMDVDGYDSIVLMLATTDAFCLTSRRSWRRNMTALVRTLIAADAPSMCVTSAASLHLARPLSPFARRLTGRHARTLNAETRRICAQTNTPMISLDAASDLTSRTYAMWGRRIGAHVADSLHKRTQQASSKPPRRRELPRRVQHIERASV
ncbi:GDSL-type esterase/lipase family protein [Glaciibacter sp. 2TAF33]|uniref:GDSL-type esterase/lipase family protein n=1 Tax=Glaciibacter sp. 2TAF33 TaxID=3233015 RepID=UPI003F93BB4B